MPNQSVESAATADVLECVKLCASHQQQFREFWSSLETAGDIHFFLPHAIDEQGRDAVLAHTGRDVYLMLKYSNQMLGYGLLRGWDEGYEIPSLGIAIHPDWRQFGLGRLLMQYLHAAAALRGAQRVRLRVHQDNKRAVALYESLGYGFEPAAGEYLTGFNALQRT